MRARRPGLAKVRSKGQQGQKPCRGHLINQEREGFQAGGISPVQILPDVVHGGLLCLLSGPSHQGRLRSLLLLSRTQGNGRCLRGLRQRKQGGEQRERIRLRETIPRKHDREFVELGFRWLFSSKFQKALQVIDDWGESTALVVCRAAT